MKIVLFLMVLIFQGCAIIEGEPTYNLFINKNEFKNGNIIIRIEKDDNKLECKKHNDCKNEYYQNKKYSKYDKHFIFNGKVMYEANCPSNQKCTTLFFKKNEQEGLHYREDKKDKIVENAEKMYFAIHLFSNAFYERDIKKLINNEKIKLIINKNQLLTKEDNIYNLLKSKPTLIIGDRNISFEKDDVGYLKWETRKNGETRISWCRLEVFDDDDSIDQITNIENEDDSNTEVKDFKEIKNTQIPIKYPYELEYYFDNKKLNKIKSNIDLNEFNITLVSNGIKETINEKNVQVYFQKNISKVKIGHYNFEDKRIELKNKDYALVENGKIQIHLKIKQENCKSFEFNPKIKYIGDQDISLYEESIQSSDFNIFIDEKKYNQKNIELCEGIKLKVDFKDKNFEDIDKTISTNDLNNLEKLNIIKQNKPTLIVLVGGKRNINQLYYKYQDFRRVVAEFYKVFLPDFYTNLSQIVLIDTINLVRKKPNYLYDKNVIPSKKYSAEINLKSFIEKKSSHSIIDFYSNIADHLIKLVKNTSQKNFIILMFSANTFTMPSDIDKYININNSNYDFKKFYIVEIGNKHFGLKGISSDLKNIGLDINYQNIDINDKRFYKNLYDLVESLAKKIDEEAKVN